MGWAEICQALQPLAAVTVVEVYPGCDTNGIEASLTSVLKPDLIIRSEEAFLSADMIEKKISSELFKDFSHLLATFFNSLSANQQEH